MNHNIYKEADYAGDRLMRDKMEEEGLVEGWKARGKNEKLKILKGFLPAIIVDMKKGNHAGPRRLDGLFTKEDWKDVETYIIKEWLSPHFKP